MPNPKVVDPYSVCAAPVGMQFKGEPIGTATGFFWRVDSRTFLISNWHVFSGRNPQTGQPIAQKTGVVPDALSVEAFCRGNLADPFHMQIVISVEPEIVLWRQHKHHGQKADVALIEVTNLIENFQKQHQFDVSPFCINEASSTDIAVNVGSDIFVLGFPKNIRKTGVLPIWKRGSIATEYDFDVDDVPSFLIDTATREGMSGAPVVIRSVGGYVSPSGSTALGPGTFTQFLGVYSGRHVAGIDEAHLGIVWKKQLIDEIVADPAPGSFELYP